MHSRNTRRYKIRMTSATKPPSKNAAISSEGGGKRRCAGIAYINESMTLVMATRPMAIATTATMS